MPSYPGVYVSEVDCFNDVSCCTTLDRCQAMCETAPQCIEFHWYIETSVFGTVNCDCFLMDERYLSQAGRVQPSSVAGNRTEYSAVCTGDSLTTLDNGEFSALTIDQGDVEISISIIEVNDADDTSGPTSQAVESIGLEVVEDVLGEEGGTVYYGSSGEDVLFVVVLGDENFLGADAVEAGLKEYNRVATAAGSEHVLNEFTSDQLEKETPFKDDKETRRRHLSSSESSTHDVTFVFVGSSNSTTGPETTEKLLDRLAVLAGAEETWIRPLKLEFMESSLSAAQSWSQPRPKSTWMWVCAILLIYPMGLLWP